MFARTKRLTLRPAWPEDAPALAEAIGHESVARMLMRVPFPYSIDDAHAFAVESRADHAPRFLILSHEGDTPTLIGGIALNDFGGEAGVELGYWLTPPAWGRGYATEAGRAVLDIARHALPLTRIGAWHFADNPASGTVLRKLGFRATGRTVMKRSVARMEAAPAISYALDLDEDQSEPMRIAA